MMFSLVPRASDKETPSSHRQVAPKGDNDLTISRMRRELCSCNDGKARFWAFRSDENQTKALKITAMLFLCLVCLLSRFDPYKSGKPHRSS